MGKAAVSAAAGRAGVMEKRPSLREKSLSMGKESVRQTQEGGCNKARGGRVRWRAAERAV